MGFIGMDEAMSQNAIPLMLMLDRIGFEH
jgi:hypothetical protein